MEFSETNKYGDESVVGLSQLTDIALSAGEADNGIYRSFSSQPDPTFSQAIQELPSQPDIPPPEIVPEFKPAEQQAEQQATDTEPSKPQLESVDKQETQKPLSTLLSMVPVTDYAKQSPRGHPLALPSQSPAQPVQSGPSASEVDPPSHPKSKAQRRGPMDEMRQLVRILVKLMPHSMGHIHGEGGVPNAYGNNKITEEQIKHYINQVMGEAPKPKWGLPDGWGDYLASACCHALTHS